MLHMSHLNKSYKKGVKALDDISLTIGKGMFGLLGPNGAGKSTLIRTIATLQEPDSGSIDFDGVDVLHDKFQIRNILGYLPQEFGIYLTVTAEDMLYHLATLKGIVNRKQRKEEVDSLLEMTNLTEHRKKKLGTYSGGMKQRFGIAQALLGSPKLIILDEPTAGLDPSERDKFHNLLSTVCENKLVILSTHIVSDVSQLCNDMAIIHNGRVLVQIHPLDAIKNLRGKIWKLTVSKSETEVASKKWNVVTSRLLYDMGMLKIFSQSCPGPDFELIEPDLEDVYFSFIKGYIGVQNGFFSSMV